MTPEYKYTCELEVKRSGIEGDLWITVQAADFDDAYHKVLLFIQAVNGQPNVFTVVSIERVNTGDN